MSLPDSIALPLLYTAVITASLEDEVRAQGQSGILTMNFSNLPCSLDRTPCKSAQRSHPIAEEIADALHEALPYASTFVRLNDPRTGDHHCAARPAHENGMEMPSQFRLWQDAAVDEVLSHRYEPGTNAVAVPIQSDLPAEHNGFLAACSPRQDFPTARDNAVLQVAAVAAKEALDRLINDGGDQPDDLLDEADLTALLNERRAADSTATEAVPPPQYMTALGTFAAGLSHDLGNLLLPIRLRLATIESRLHDCRFAQDFGAIRSCLDSMQRLTHGLELFSLDPGRPSASDDVLLLHEWWSDVESFMRNVLPPDAHLLADFPADLPGVRIARHCLAQVMLNLVQNAGEALARRGYGRVGVWAEPGDDGSTVVIAISDDGPGMTADVADRCFEPFFTTKTRAISTGLGLSLVHGIIRRAGGSIDLQTQEGNGVTVRLTLPAAQPSNVINSMFGRRSAKTHAATDICPAMVTVDEARLGGFITTFLQALGFAVVTRSGEPCDETRLWVTDDIENVRVSAAKFLEKPLRKVVVLGDKVDIGAHVNDQRLVWLGSKPDRAGLSRVLRQCAQQVLRSSVSHGAHATEP